MRKHCGLAVQTVVKTRSLHAGLYTAVVCAIQGTVNNMGLFPQQYTHSIQRLFHSFLVFLTTVFSELFPIIHTPNKNYKNFIQNNLLLITGSSV